MYGSKHVQVRPDKVQLICDCITPDRCPIRYHLSDKARLDALPDLVNHAKERITAFAKTVDRVHVMRRPALEAWCLELAEAVKCVELYLPREHRRAA